MSISNPSNPLRIGTVTSITPGDGQLTLDLKPVVLLADAWDEDKRQTVDVPGILADETKQLIIPTPAIESQSAFYAAGVFCVGQGEGSLTFEVHTVPEEDITLYVGISNRNISASSPVSSNEVYSTEETRIGTWIDGKPLYRKVVSGNLSSKKSDTATIATITNVDQVITTHGYVDYSDGIRRTEIPTGMDNGTTVQLVASKVGNDSDIQAFNSTTSLVGQPCTIIVEYTKLTDEEG